MLLVVYETVIATLALTHMAPPANFGMRLGPSMGELVFEQEQCRNQKDPRCIPVLWPASRQADGLAIPGQDPWR